MAANSIYKTDSMIICFGYLQGSPYLAAWQQSKPQYWVEITRGCPFYKIIDSIAWVANQPDLNGVGYYGC